MSVDELAVLDGGKCILQLRGVRPFLSSKYDVTKHPNFHLTSHADPKNAFDLDRYLKAQLRLRSGDLYAAYEVDVSGDETAV